VIYSLLVLSSPLKSTNAARFAQAACERGHQFVRVFFMDDGVYHGQGNAVYPQDETPPGTLWQSLRDEYGLELVLCISSSLKRGILNSEEAARHEQHSAAIHPAFEIGGLGQLVDAAAHSDRLITFGH